MQEVIVVIFSSSVTLGAWRDVVCRKLSHQFELQAIPGMASTSLLDNTVLLQFIYQWLLQNKLNGSELHGEKGGQHCW